MNVPDLNKLNVYPTVRCVRLKNIEYKWNNHAKARKHYKDIFIQLMPKRLDKKGKLIKIINYN